MIWILFRRDLALAIFKKAPKVLPNRWMLM